MWKTHLPLLRCPETKRELILKDEVLGDSGKVKSGLLVEKQSGKAYPIVDYIPRFVSSDNYAGNFGFQWNLHKRTQHDQFSGLKASETRFWKETRWESNLKGQLILEAGSGSGRFTKFPLEAGATVVSFDYSHAVTANYAANGNHPNLLLIQADIFRMPFEEAFFDKVLCLGVIQHTPDPKKAFACLVAKLKSGGKIATDVYYKSLFGYYLNPMYYLRPFTRNQSPESLYHSVKSHVDRMWPLVRVLRKIPKVGHQVSRKLLLVSDHSNQFPEASDETLKEWAYLDTFDWFSPRYDSPQSLRTYRNWHLENGLRQIEVHRGYNGLEARAEKS